MHPSYGSAIEQQWVVIPHQVTVSNGKSGERGRVEGGLDQGIARFAQTPFKIDRPALAVTEAEAEPEVT
jgi:hypothetical protein